MATVLLEYDARNVSLKKALDLIVSLGAKIKTPEKKQLTATAKRATTGIEQALQEVKEGKINRYDSPEELFNKLGI